MTWPGYPVGAWSLERSPGDVNVPPSWSATVGWAASSPALMRSPHPPASVDPFCLEHAPHQTQGLVRQSEHRGRGIGPRWEPSIKPSQVFLPRALPFLKHFCRHALVKFSGQQCAAAGGSGGLEPSAEGRGVSNRSNGCRRRNDPPPCPYPSVRPLGARRPQLRGRLLARGPWDGQGPEFPGRGRGHRQGP